MIYGALADLVLVVHLLFVAFVVLGGFLVLRRPRLAWAHLPTAVWGVAIEFAGWVCPLTPLENELRVRGGEAGYSGGFIEHYITAALYPAGLSRGVQIVLGSAVLILNLVIYTVFFARSRARHVARASFFLTLIAACSNGSDGPRGAGADTTPVTQTPGSSTSGTTSPSPSGCSSTLLRGTGIGALRIGATLASVRSSCDVRDEATIAGAEGMPARIAYVEVNGKLVEAEIVDDKVWRLAIGLPDFRTSDSLGVGTPLSRLLKLPQPRGMMGEGALYFASPAHCGLSFKLSENRPLPPSGQNWNAAALSRLPPTTKVTEVLAVGC
jgi:hypothetical protein